MVCSVIQFSVEVAIPVAMVLPLLSRRVTGNDPSKNHVPGARPLTISGLFICVFGSGADTVTDDVAFGVGSGVIAGGVGSGVSMAVSIGTTGIFVSLPVLFE